MKKLIEMDQKSLIICDNKDCDYEILNETGDPNIDIKSYINKPCPKCGDNLLTEKDYLDSIRILSIINWVNRWFSWIIYLVPKNRRKYSVMDMHVHNGININSNKN